MEVLGAVADECEAVCRSVGFFLRWAERRERTGGGGGAPRAMLWAGIRRSYRTRVVVVMVYPERCSGLVYGVPMGHGAGVGEGREKCDGLVGRA
jgi:hypothetical protein